MLPEHLPLEVRTALERLRDAAETTDAVSALVLYGDAVRSHRSGREVNVAVILGDADPAVLDALAGPLQRAWRAARVEAFLLTTAEVARLADVFPVRVLDLKTHGITLYGDNPFQAVAVDPEHLRLRVEQELRNHLMRLRRRYVAANGDPATLQAMLDRSAGWLPAPLGALLRLVGDEQPDPPLAAAVARFTLDDDVARRLVDVHAGKADDDPAALTRGVLALLARVVQVADELEVQS